MANKLLTRSHGQRTGHPFRQNLPVTFVQTAKEEHDSDRAAIAKGSGIGDDASLFLLSFFAFFTAFSIFIF